MNTEKIDQLLEGLPGLLGQAQYHKILLQVLQAFDCETGTLHRLRDPNGLLELVAQQGIPEVLLDKIERIPLGKGIAGAAAAQREAVQMCNLQTDRSGVARPEAKKTQVAGSLAVPMLCSERVCGTLGIGKRAPYDFSEQEVFCLEKIATAMVARGEL